MWGRQKELRQGQSGGRGPHTKSCVSPSDFIHTSSNTLLAAYLFAPWAPGAAWAFQATVGPLCSPSERGLLVHTACLHLLWSSRHSNNTVPLLTRTWHHNLLPTQSPRKHADTPAVEQFRKRMHATVKGDFRLKQASQWRYTDTNWGTMKSAWTCLKSTGTERQTSESKESLFQRCRWGGRKNNGGGPMFRC